MENSGNMSWDEFIFDIFAFFIYRECQERCKSRQLCRNHGGSSVMVWHLIGGSLIFQHDNELIHNANVEKAYLKRKTHRNTISSELASPEPNLKIIEQCRIILREKRTKRKHSGMSFMEPGELFLKTIWRNYRNSSGCSEE